MKKEVKKIKEEKRAGNLPLIISILAILSGIIALLIGWMGYGGYMFGIPAILLAIYSYKKDHKWLAGLTIIFSCIGVAESFVMMNIVIPTVTPKGFTSKIGEIIDIDGFDFMVNSVNQANVYIDYSEILEDYKAVLAKPNYKFVKVKVTIKSKIKEGTPPLINLTLVTDKGYLYNPTYIYRYQTDREVRNATMEEVNIYYCKEFSEFKSIPPGETSEGCLFFEILENTNPTKLEFQTKLIGGKAISIDLIS
jgi:hypothetical protein